MGVSENTRKTAAMGLLFALAVTLSALEGMLSLPLMPPGVKLGLSNVVTMYCVFSLGCGKALVLAALKAMLALLIRGLAAGLLSLCGGLLSVAAMALLLMLLGGAASYLLVGVTGAVAHNLGQLAAAALLLRLPTLWYYLPALLIAGICMGVLTAVVTGVTIPHLPDWLRKSR